MHQNNTRNVRLSINSAFPTSKNRSFSKSFLRTTALFAKAENSAVVRLAETTFRSVKILRIAERSSGNDDCRRQAGPGSVPSLTAAWSTAGGKREMMKETGRLLVTRVWPVATPRPDQCPWTLVDDRRC